MCNYVLCTFLVFIAGMLESSHGRSDIRLSTPQLIRKHGYPAESHEVVTEDGYILTIHRIPYSSKSPADRNKRAVFLQHGLTSSSMDWVIMGPEKSLGYLLADEGYDVWMGNCRGNTYSKRHRTLSASSTKFWNFSWHEMGLYDLPAEIDYVLNRTGSDDLYYVGMSMGTTMFFVFASERPEYNQKIRLMIAEAPVAFMKRTATPLIKTSVTPMLLRALGFFGMNEVLPGGRMANMLMSRLCEMQSLKGICGSFVHLVSGFDPKQLNESMLPLILYNAPTGSSSKTMKHYLQIIKSGRFQKWDYGTMNEIKYKQKEPPDYNLKAVTAPVAIMYAENDALSDAQDALKLNKTLPNVVELYKVPWKTFSHIGYVYANDIKPLVNDEVMRLVKISKSLLTTQLNIYTT